MIPATINITAVEQVGEYVLRLAFDCRIPRWKKRLDG